MHKSRNSPISKISMRICLVKGRPGPDLNGNNRPDPIIFNYSNEAYYPIHLRNNFLNQFQNKKKLFNRFYDYSKATYDDIFSNDEKQKLESLEV